MMQIAETCTVRLVKPSDLPLLLSWRNHPDVRSWMLTSHEIAMEEHRAWYERAVANPRKCLLVAEDRGRPYGYAAFDGAVAGDVADWGFYVAPGSPKGSGRNLGRTALDFAFQRLKLHKVCGQVLDFNVPSLRLHTSLGFQQEGVLRQQHRRGADYHDLICFGLLRQEWLTQTNQDQRT